MGGYTGGARRGREPGGGGVGVVIFGMEVGCGCR